MKQAKVLNPREFKQVLAVTNAGKHGQRNRLILMLSHYSGLRVGEIASLRWSDIIDADGLVRSIFYLDAQNTKSKEARSVHVNSVLMKEITAFKKTEFRVDNYRKAFIISQKNKAFSANSLCQLFRNLYIAAGIDGASSHSGRRWFITKLAHKGVSPKVIMELAGHKHLGTTQRYIDVNEEMKMQAVSLL